MPWIRALMCGAVCLICAQGVRGDEDLGTRALTVLRSRCLRCHSGDGSEGEAFDASAGLPVSPGPDAVVRAGLD